MQSDFTKTADAEPGFIEQALAGSEAAFAELVRLHQASVRAYLSRFLRDHDAVRDLAQETFLSAYRKLSSYRREASLRLWLLAIARNHALMYLRSEERRRSREAGSLASDVAGWMIGRAEVETHDRTMAALRACLQGLPPHSADLVEEHYLKGRDLREIAQKTGKKETALCMALSRIRGLLRECIGQRLSGAGIKL